MLLEVHTSEFVVADVYPDRLLKESGRFSAHSVFIVGYYSDDIKLGEGFGSSLDMAEYRVSSLSSDTSK